MGGMGRKTVEEDVVFHGKVNPWKIGMGTVAIKNKKDWLPGFVLPCRLRYKNLFKPF
jgi:hypothetical protein